MEPTALGSARPTLYGGTLTVVSGDTRGSSVDVGPNPIPIGRRPGCRLVLQDGRVSATHCEVRATEHGVHLRDLGSTNGTHIGNAKVTEALLCGATTIRCGDTLIEFEPGRGEAAPVSRSKQFGRLVGTTQTMRMLFARLRTIAASDMSVLIEGETGTGKELVAQAIHDASPRAQKPFVVIDCAGLSPSLAESILFGHERGAFTGAIAKRVSPFVEAQGGSVFLDELGELPLELQPKLLRALAEQRIQSVGAKGYTPVDIRVVAATRRNLGQEINLGRFRDDLFFRIADVRVELPPLRERTEDIMPLIERMMADMGKIEAFGRVAPESIDSLVGYRWPGNVRELRSVVKRVLAFDEGGPIDLSQHLAQIWKIASKDESADRREERTFMECQRDCERAYFLSLHEQANGNVSEIARIAAVDRATVRNYMKRHAIGRYGRKRS
jgi:transcriptional regulator with GAF, ATPase, and Fis domain